VISTNCNEIGHALGTKDRGLIVYQTGLRLHSQIAVRLLALCKSPKRSRVTIPTNENPTRVEFKRSKEGHSRKFHNGPYQIRGKPEIVYVVETGAFGDVVEVTRS